MGLSRVPCPPDKMSAFICSPDRAEYYVFPVMNVATINSSKVICIDIFDFIAEGQTNIFDQYQRAKNACHIYDF